MEKCIKRFWIIFLFSEKYALYEVPFKEQKSDMIIDSIIYFVIHVVAAQLTF